MSVTDGGTVESAVNGVLITMAWTGGKVYKGAKNMGMRYQNWKYGKAGGNGSSTPATTTAPAGTNGSKWGSVETKTTYNTNYTTYTKWTR